MYVETELANRFYPGGKNGCDQPGTGAFPPRHRDRISALDSELPIKKESIKPSFSLTLSDCMR